MVLDKPDHGQAQGGENPPLFLGLAFNAALLGEENPGEEDAGGP
jgi:hypothetical protein